MAEPLVKLTFPGVLYLKGDRLVAGDTDVLKKFVAAWGGARQYGTLQMVWTPAPIEQTIVSDDMGAYSEAR